MRLLTLPSSSLVPSVALLVLATSLHARSDVPTAVPERLASSGTADLAHPGVTDATFLPDGRTLVTTSAEGTKLWDLATGREHIPSAGAFALAVSRERRIVAPGRPSSIEIPLVRAAPIKPVPGRPSPTTKPAEIGAIALGRDQQSLAIYLPELRRIVIRRDGSEVAIALTDHHAGSVDLLFLSHDELLVAAPPRPLTVYSITTGRPQRQITGLQHRRLALSPDGSVVAAWGFHTGIQLWEVATGDELHPRPGHRAAITSSAISPDGEMLATASLDGTAKLWDLAGGAELFTIGGLDHPTSIAFSPDGDRLAVSLYMQIQIWDPRRRVLLRTTAPVNGSGTNTHVAFSPDGKELAYWNHRHSVVILDVATGTMKESEGTPAIDQ